MTKAQQDRCPPELAGDIVNKGIMLTGGGALLQHLALRITGEINVPVLVAENPLHCVVNGTGEALKNLHLFEIPKTKKCA